MLKVLMQVSSVSVLVLILFLCVVVPLYPVWGCRESKGSDVWEGGFTEGEDYNIWVVADPQIVGARRDNVWHWLNNKMNDLYYEFVTTAMWEVRGPFDLTVVLGDIMSFQYYRDEEFYDIADRFRSSFYNSLESLTVLAGNHDVGYGAELPDQVVKRFEETFNKRHWVKKMKGMWLVGCDALELDGSARGESWKFLKSLIQSDVPVVLMTHIPLWKPAGSCPGDNPEIKYAGQQVYTQTTLSQNTTSWILNNLRPKAVLSGHDHQGCTYLHPTNPPTPEWTLEAIQGDHHGNTGYLRYSPRTDTLTFTQCSCFTTRVILVALITLPILLVLTVLLSCCVIRRSRKVKEE